MERVLLLSPRAPVTLEMARQLSAAGDEVLVADSMALHLCRLSTAVTRSFVVPPPRQQPAAWIDALERIVVEHQVDRVVPTCEEVFWLAGGRERLTSHASVLCAAFDTLLRLHDKAAFIALCDALDVDGTSVPETHALTAETDAIDLLGDAPEAWVLKPAFSRFASTTLIQPSARQLRRARASADAPLIAQRFVAGRQLSTYSVAHDGELSLHSTYGAPWRAGQGASVYFTSEQHPIARAFAEAVVRKLGFTGQIAFDFIEDASGTLWPIECNPRATSGLHLFHGLQGLKERAAAALKGPLPGGEVVEPAPGTRAMLFGALALYAPLAVRGPRDVARLAADVWRARDVIVSLRDPAPTLMQLLTSATLAWRGLCHGVGALAASTIDIEHNGPADVRRLDAAPLPASEVIEVVKDASELGSGGAHAN